MKTAPSLLVALVFLLAAGGAAGGEKQMTLDQCLRAALDNALEIREGRHGPPIARTFVEEADAEFDHLLSFRTSGGKSLTPSGTLFGGADQVSEQTFAFEAGIEKRLRSGGRYGLSYRTRDLLTSSTFYTVRPQWTNSLAFTVSHSLLRYAGSDYNAARIRLAESGALSAGEDYRGILISTLAAVERGYWDLVFVREDLEVKRHSKRVADELLRISQRRLTAGAGTRIEVVQAQAGVAEREKELILAEHRVRNGEDLLRSFVFPFADHPGEELRILPVDRVGAQVDQQTESFEARIRTAFESRPDIRSMKQSLEAAGIRVLQSENELLPRLDVFGTIGLTGLDDDVIPSAGEALRAEHPAWEVGISLEFPLGNRAAEARHRRALLERSRLATGFEKLKNRVMVEVRRAVRNFDTVRREIAAARKSTAAAEAQFEAEKDRLAADKSTNWQLLQVEEQLSQARSQELLALIAHKLARVDVEEATGTYLSSRGISVPVPPVNRPPERTGE